MHKYTPLQFPSASGFSSKFASTCTMLRQCAEARRYHFQKSAISSASSLTRSWRSDTPLHISCPCACACACVRAFILFINVGVWVHVCSLCFFFFLFSFLFSHSIAARKVYVEANICGAAFASAAAALLSSCHG